MSSPPRARHAVPRPKSRSSVIKKGLAGTVAAAMTVGGLALTSTLPAHAADPLTGTVFLDYGGDGEYTATGDVQDALLGGITVTAYDPSGTPVGSTATEFSTSGSGNYSLPLDGVENGTPLRVEFSDLPGGLYETYNAGQSGVQSTTAGSGQDVDFGAFDPAQYNPVLGYAANPAVSTAIMLAGSRNHTDVADDPVVVATRWGDDDNLIDGSAPNFNARTTWATYSQVGSIFSLANHTSKNSVFAAASYK